jgi:hypothetical protein
MGIKDMKVVVRRIAVWRILQSDEVGMMGLYMLFPLRASSMTKQPRRASFP